MTKKGFTLLEMLIVLSVITMIFTLTVPNIQKRLETIREKECASLVEVINSNIIQYELDFNEVPTSISDLLDNGYITEKQCKCMNNKIIEIVDGQAEAN